MSPSRTTSLTARWAALNQLGVPIAVATEPIERLQARLREIPKAMWEESFDPFQRPHYPMRQVETLLAEDGARPVIEGGETAQYPPFIERELLEAKDREVGVDSKEGMGIDALAWYVSFHKSQGPWGIFIPTSSLIYLEMRHLQSPRLRISKSSKRQVALELLLEHELFHFAADYACAQWEILMHTPSWRALMQQRLDLKLPYFSLEESLANAYMLRRLRHGWDSRTQDAVRRFVDRQPPGYNQAFDYLADAPFRTALEELAKNYLGLHAFECHLNIQSLIFESGFPLAVSLAVIGSLCPIHIINDLGRFHLPEISVRFIKCIPEIVETEGFQKLFRQVPQDIQKRWARKKDQLKLMLPRHPEFENFRDYFSLRLGHSFRAHLRPVAGSTYWEAFEIGPHTKMGHG